MLARNWKHLWLLLLPCKTSKKCKHGKTRGKTNDIKSKLAWKPVNPHDCGWKNLHQIIMRTILHERVTIHYNTTIWFTNLFLCFKPWRSPQQKQQWIKNGTNWKRFRRGTWRESEVRKRWSMKQGRTAQKFILPHWWTSVIWKMPNWRQSTKNTKVELYSEAILWKIILVLMQYFTEQGSSASQMTAAKIMDIISKLPGFFRTSTGCSIGFFPGKNGRCSKIIEKSKIGMSRHVDSSTTTQTA